LLGLVVALLGKGDGREAGGRVIFPVKMGIHVPRVEGGIAGSEARAAAQALLGLTHERKEVGDIAAVEGLRHFGEDELAVAENLRHDDAGGIAPIVFTDLHALSRHRIARRSCGGCSAVVSSLAAETTIGVAARLLVFVEAIGDIRFGIVLPDPSENVFGVERNAVHLRQVLSAEFSEDEPDAVGQQKLQGGIGHLTQESSEMPFVRQAGKGIETEGHFGRESDLGKSALGQ